LQFIQKKIVAEREGSLRKRVPSHDLKYIEGGDRKTQRVITAIFDEHRKIRKLVKREEKKNS